MPVLTRYNADLQRPDFYHDFAQEKVVQHLQRLYLQLVEQYQGGPGVMLKRLLGRKRTQSIKAQRFITQLERGTSYLLGRESQEPIRGLYLWGGVGRGKTYLVDSFYEALPFPQKMRTHFHRFMKRVHEDLKGLKGERNPLIIIGKRLASETRVICFDEFFVSDITDAMILATLLDELFKNGVCLVATSNIAPDELYRDGLQRARFLPAIELLKQHTEIINVDGGIDYRLRALEQAELYHWPLDEKAESSLEKSFLSLLPEHCAVSENEKLMIENREILARKIGNDVALFDFRELCDGPRSQNDYIELGKIFHAVLLTNVEQMNASKDDTARRFVNLVDEFYDRNVKLIISAEVELKALYSGGRLEFEFQRTLSRLLEMQSHEYLSRPHKP